MFKSILFLLCTVALGCSSTRPPITQFQSSKLKNSFEEAVSVEVNFELLNKNPEPIRLVRFKYAALIDGKVVYEGLMKAEQTVPYSAIGETITTVIDPQCQALKSNDLISCPLIGDIHYPTKCQDDKGYFIIVE